MVIWRVTLAALLTAALSLFAIHAPRAQFNCATAGFCSPTPTAAPGGCSQATSFLARTSGLSVNETTGYTNAICYWVTQGVYSHIDVAYIFATKNTATAMLNLVTSGTFDGTLTIGGGSFSVDHGITGDGSSTDVFTGPTAGNGFVPSTSGGNYGASANNGFIGVYIMTSDTTGGNFIEIGARDITSSSNIGGFESGVVVTSLNDAFFTDDQTNTNSQGNYITSRTGASAVSIRKNEGSLGTTTSAAVSLPTGAFCIFNTGGSAATTDCAGGTAFSNRQVAAAVIGGGLTTNAQADAIAHGINCYLLAVGTSVYGSTC